MRLFLALSLLCLVLLAIAAPCSAAFSFVRNRVSIPDDAAYNITVTSDTVPGNLKLCYASDCASCSPANGGVASTMSGSGVAPKLVSGTTYAYEITASSSEHFEYLACVGGVDQGNFTLLSVSAYPSSALMSGEPLAALPSDNYLPRSVHLSIKDKIWWVFASTQAGAVCGAPPAVGNAKLATVDTSAGYAGTGQANWASVSNSFSGYVRVCVQANGVDDSTAPVRPATTALGLNVLALSFDSYRMISGMTGTVTGFTTTYPSAFDPSLHIYLSATPGCAGSTTSYIPSFFPYTPSKPYVCAAVGAKNVTLGPIKEVTLTGVRPSRTSTATAPIGYTPTITLTGTGMGSNDKVQLLTGTGNCPAYDSGTYSYYSTSNSGDDTTSTVSGVTLPTTPGSYRVCLIMGGVGSDYVNVSSLLQLGLPSDLDGTTATPTAGQPAQIKVSGTNLNPYNQDTVRVCPGTSCTTAGCGTPVTTSAITSISSTSVYFSVTMPSAASHIVCYRVGPSNVAAGNDDIKLPTAIVASAPDGFSPKRWVSGLAVSFTVTLTGVASTDKLRPIHASGSCGGSETVATAADISGTVSGKIFTAAAATLSTLSPNGLYRLCRVVGGVSSEVTGGTFAVVPTTTMTLSPSRALKSADAVFTVTGGQQMDTANGDQIRLWASGTCTGGSGPTMTMTSASATALQWQYANTATGIYYYCYHLQGVATGAPINQATTGRVDIVDAAAANQRIMTTPIAGTQTLTITGQQLATTDVVTLSLASTNCTAGDGIVRTPTLTGNAATLTATFTDLQQGGRLGRLCYKLQAPDAAGTVMVKELNSNINIVQWVSFAPRRVTAGSSVAMTLFASLGLTPGYDTTLDSLSVFTGATCNTGTTVVADRRQSSGGDTTSWPAFTAPATGGVLKACFKLNNQAPYYDLAAVDNTGALKFEVVSIASVVSNATAPVAGDSVDLTLNGAQLSPLDSVALRVGATSCADGAEVARGNMNGVGAVINAIFTALPAGNLSLCYNLSGAAATIFRSNVLSVGCQRTADCADSTLACLGGVCTKCTNNTQCDDDDVCNGIEQCNVASGLCIPDPAPAFDPASCSDGDTLCSVGKCDAVLGCVTDTLCTCGDGITQGPETCDPFTSTVTGCTDCTADPGYTCDNVGENDTPGASVCRPDDDNGGGGGGNGGAVAAVSLAAVVIGSLVASLL